MKEYKFAIIRIKDNTDIYKKAKQYLSSGEEYKHFNVNDKNYAKVKRCLILLCKTNEIEELHWCECEFLTDEIGSYLSCKTLYSSSSWIVIKNVEESIFLDITTDFKQKYMATESFKSLFEQFERLGGCHDGYIKYEKEYKKLESEIGILFLSQKNEYCKRQYDLKDPTLDSRGEFQRDYDRIVYSKSYRRMVDKRNLDYR